MAPRRPPAPLEEALSAENRLAAEQLVALTPGDVVTIDSGQEVGRPRRTGGTVVRIGDSQVLHSASE